MRFVFLVVVFSFQHISFESVRGDACHSSRVVRGNAYPVMALEHVQTPQTDIFREREQHTDLDSLRETFQAHF